MAETAQLRLPLVAAAQAQKHVTVNAALARLDGMVQLVLQSVGVAVPPTPTDGVCYGVPAGAAGAWAGRAGLIALGTNGGWDFVGPQPGWRAFVADAGVQAVHDGSGWRLGQATLSPSGAGLALKVTEVDHTLGAGTQSVTSAVIPAGAAVFGVTARVLTPITGTLTSWQLGNPGAPGRYGTELGLGAGAFAQGLLGQPTAFYADEALQLDASGGQFAGGTVRLAVHFLTLTVPGV